MQSSGDLQLGWGGICMYRQICVKTQFLQSYPGNCPTDLGLDIDLELVFFNLRAVYVFWPYHTLLYGCLRYKI